MKEVEKFLVYGILFGYLVMFAFNLLLALASNDFDNNALWRSVSYLMGVLMGVWLVNLNKQR